MKTISFLAAAPAVSALSTSSQSAGALLQAAGARNVTQIESLLQNLVVESLEGDGVEGMEKSIIDALTVIRGQLVTNIRNSMINEHNVDQQEIMKNLECFTQCKIDKREAEEDCTAHDTAASELNSQHVSCRTSLLAKYVTKIEECNGLDDWVRDFKLKPKIKEQCVYDPAYICHTAECPDSSPCTPSIKEEFGGWLQTIISQATMGHATWTTLHNKCKAAYHAYIKQDAQCDVTQNSFELKMCNARQCRDMACNDQYQKCRARCEAAYHKTNKRVECAEHDRKIDWSSTEKIECYLRIILASPSDEAIQEHCTDKTKCLSEWRTNEYDKCNNVCIEVDYDSGSYSQHARRGSVDGDGLSYNEFWHESEQHKRQHGDMAVHGDSSWGVNTTHRVTDGDDTALEKRCTQHLDIDFQPLPDCEPCKEEAPMPCSEEFIAQYYQRFLSLKGVTELDGKEYRKCHTEKPGEHTQKWAYNLCECRTCSCKEPSDFCPMPSTCPSIIRGQDYLGGGDYKQVILSTAEKCQNLCSWEDKCQSFAYTASNQICYLKTGVPELKIASHVDSGLPCPRYEFGAITHIVDEEEA